MADTYEAFYNGKPLNPNRGLPTMTYAQAEDCGLTESERLWCRTDGEDTPITADDIPYDSNNSVKDKIDDLENGVSLLTIPANTYNTWALALQALYVEYNKLTTEQKKRCSIIRNDDIVYKCTAISSAFTSVYAGSTTRTIIQSCFLQSGIFLNHALEGSTITTTSQSNDPQAHKLELRLN